VVPDLVVVDASAIVELLLGGPRASSVADMLSARVLAAPAHLDVEVVSALARIERAGRVTNGDLLEMVDDLAGAPITRYPLAQLSPLVCGLRANVAVADAYYVALAASLDASLVTVDDRLAAACRTLELCAVATL
jgi:predicted nucleic acid-binding protein